MAYKRRKDKSRCPVSVGTSGSFSPSARLLGFLWTAANTLAGLGLRPPPLYRVPPRSVGPCVPSRRAVSPSPGSGGVSMDGGAYRCRSNRRLEGGQSALPGSLLFAAGLLGNLLALGLLWQHQLRARLQRAGGGRPRASAFYLLVSTLVATDLLGKCLLSPIVLAAYARNLSLSELWPPPRSAVAVQEEDAAAGEAVPGRLCQLFAFLMAFFGLAPTVLLLAMALECWLSLGHPYFYEHHTSRRLGALLTCVAAALCALFCALPLLGVGAHVQYCPGTWCFIRMAGGGRAYSVLYASLLGALVLAIGLCNLSSMRSLYRMARRRRSHLAGGGAQSAAAPPCAGRTEELGQLVLLALMTVLFTVCSLPVIVRAYVGAFSPDFDEKADLTALRFFSVNSIVDPWVFIIFRTSLFRSCLRAVSRRLSAKRAPHSQLLEIWGRKESGPLQ
ncbi:prostaglandin D2 receptor [Rhineura floridana]|uniref:prostaglandin D2 receptor n=1 Tax=Rhineura floridana TaxID=261503 RepID=UPI002AC82670|nr:prostaglandin D2 receptor [Rhineura floridana]